MLIPIIAGIGALCMSNPPKRKRRKAKRRNPHTAPDGWRYSIKDNREWSEIQIIARTPAGKLNEGRKSFFPYSSGDRASKREARAEAKAHLARLLTRANPRRKRKTTEAEARAIFDRYEMMKRIEAAKGPSTWNDGLLKRLRAKRSNPRRGKRRSHR